MGQIYRLTGIDGYEICGDLLGFQRGFVLETVSKKRTGKSLPDAPDIDVVLAALEKDGSTVNEPNESLR